MQSEAEAVLSVLKIVGSGQVFFGSGDGLVTTNLMAIPANGKSTKELTAQLEAVSVIRSVFVIAISDPISQAELSGVRNLFASVNRDTSDIGDEQLTLYIASKLRNEYTYYLDIAQRRNEKGLFNVRIKRLEEHPEFTPDWISDATTKKRKRQYAKHPFEEIETGHVVLKSKEYPVPPPPPPGKLNEMTDAQIRNWLRKNDSRNLQDDNIEIRRSSEELRIIIKYDGTAETINYKIKK